MNIDLCGRKTNPLGFVHGLKHVGDQGADARIDLRDGLGDLVQSRVRIAEDRNKSHGLLEKLSLFSLLLCIHLLQWEKYVAHCGAWAQNPRE